MFDVKDIFRVGLHIISSFSTLQSVTEESDDCD